MWYIPILIEFIVFGAFYFILTYLYKKEFREPIIGKLKEDNLHEITNLLIPSLAFESNYLNFKAYSFIHLIIAIILSVIVHFMNNLILAIIIYLIILSISLMKILKIKDLYKALEDSENIKEAIKPLTNIYNYLYLYKICLFILTLAVYALNK